MREKGLKGSVTVEMAYILPSIMMIFLLIIYTVFYFHDKNILHGVAGETAVLGAQTERQPGAKEVDLQGFYKKRVSNKLILLRVTSVEVVTNTEWITVIASAGRRWMRVRAIQQTVVPKPEKKIREKRWVESVVE